MTMQRHHPWQEIGQRPDWQIEFGPLPDGIKGLTDVSTKTIWIDIGLNQAARRATLVHEMLHALGSHDSQCGPEIDAQVEQEASRALLPLDELLRVLPWATNVDEAAGELWVDTPMLRARLDHLHPSEIAAIKRTFAARDNTE